MSLKIVFLFLTAFYILRRLSAETDIKDLSRAQGKNLNKCDSFVLVVKRKDYFWKTY